MSQTKISIPKPCHENWNDMTPEMRGRFCQACEKTVIDFTQLSDRAILEKIQTTDKICGRFNQSQLDRELVVPQQKSTLWAASVTGILGLLPLTNEANAQVQPETELIEEGIMGDIDISSAETEYLIWGRLYGMQGNPIAGNVRVKGSEKQATTNDQGIYKIAAKLGDTLVFSSFAVHPQEIRAEQTEIDIVLWGEDDFGVYRIVSGQLVEKSQAVFYGKIEVEGTNRYTQPNPEGQFSIPVAVGETLVVSALGFNNQSIKIKSSDFDRPLKVEMEGVHLTGEVVYATKRTFFGRMLQKIDRFFTLKWRP